VPHTRQLRHPSPWITTRNLPPFTAVELWQKIMLLLKGSDQRMTPERFEKLFGAHFTEVRHDPDVTVYLIREHRDWYMAANVVVVNADYQHLASQKITIRTAGGR
jgi:hypothetical protein